MQFALSQKIQFGGCLHRYYKALALVAMLGFASDLKSEPQTGNEILKFNFDTPVEVEAGTWVGKGRELGKGPRQPNYPNFNSTNQAAYFSGKGTESGLLLKDSEKLRFKQGDSISMESWVKADGGASGEMYLLGKGRLGKKGLGTMNQNYGFRVKQGPQGLQIGFIFASHNGKGGDRQWHVWWSDDKAFSAGSSWHHIAFTYTFGKADSLKGYIDGKPVTGQWSFAGPTHREPVVDSDDLMIGTGSERKPGNSFKGWIDSIRLYKDTLSPALIANRYKYQEPPPPVSPANIKSGEILVQIADSGLSDNRSWPEEYPEIAESYKEEAFGLFDLPQRYVYSGIRGDRGRPILVRATAKVTLPKGKHRLLLRGRGGSRLFVDNKLTLSNKFPSGDTGGHGHTSQQDDYLNLGPDFRFAPPGNRESWTEYTGDGQEKVVMLETIIGNTGQRPELGETVVAISLEGTDSWHLLSPTDKKIAYNDASWNAYEADRTAYIKELNRENRAKQQAKFANFWKKRSDAAQAWLAKTKEVDVPKVSGKYPVLNPIDNFIGAKIDAVAASYGTPKEGDVDYFKEVLPILEAKCYDCHEGDKAKGDLALNLLSSVLKGGESDGPGITPHDPSKSSIIYRVETDDEDLIMPPKGKPLDAKEIETLKKWVSQGARWPEFRVDSWKMTGLSDDLSFLRRISLDTVGLLPTEKEIQEYLADQQPQKRERWIQRYLKDDRWADHWVSYWQDVLAENPNIINPTLNNTGPFRWWIHDSLLDNKRMDQFVTELVRLEGSNRYGGTLGFGIASQNDSPMAEKGAIVASAFLGVEMKCARCHDAPSHKSLQEDLFNIAAMLNQAPLKVPSTSSVPMDKLHEGGRKPLIQVTLAPGTNVQPKWPFTEFANPELGPKLADEADNSRSILAALVTAPENERFAKVLVNRVWERLMGRGIATNVADWERGSTTHPELLNWLAREFVRDGYDMKKLTGLIMQSHAYQRAVDSTLKESGPLYISPAPRRLEAEQIVDSLFSATGKPFNLEEVSLDLDSVRNQSNSITLGKPYRSWMLTSTSNERDRPSLSLPKIQAVSTLLEAFGWRAARQDPLSVREKTPNTLQPAIISNGIVGHWLTTFSDDHGLTKLALENQSLESFINRLYLRFYTRKPTELEMNEGKALLQKGYESRIQPKVVKVSHEPRVRPYFFTWSNHLDDKANVLAVEAEVRARHGDAPTSELNTDWRQRAEDFVWTLINHPEVIYTR